MDKQTAVRKEALVRFISVTVFRNYLVEPDHADPRLAGHDQVAVLALAAEAGRLGHPRDQGEDRLQRPSVHHLHRPQDHLHYAHDRDEGHLWLCSGSGRYLSSLDHFVLQRS